MEVIDALRFSEPCPYLRGLTSEGELRPDTESFSTYESLLRFGWRRSGDILYRYRCADCRLCVPIRIPVSRLSQGKSAKSLVRKNSDIQVRIVEPIPSDEYYSLYEKYVNTKHPGSESADPESFMSLFDAPIVVLSEYRDKEAKLRALGFIDLLPTGLSSVYFAFDTDEGRRSLGRFSVYAESAIAKRMGKLYYYLGFWVPFAPTMDYKADFRPFELALPAQGSSDSGSTEPVWTEFSSKGEALDRLSAAPRR